MFSLFDKIFKTSEEFNVEGRRRIYLSFAIALSAGFSYILSEIIFQYLRITVDFLYLFGLISTVSVFAAITVFALVWDNRRITWAKHNEDRFRFKAIEEQLIDLKKDFDSGVKRIKSLGVEKEKEETLLLERYEKFEKAESILIKEREKILLRRSENKSHLPVEKAKPLSLKPE
jgi:hypothetical protein